MPNRTISDNPNKEEIPIWLRWQLRHRFRKVAYWDIWLGRAKVTFDDGRCDYYFKR